MLASVIANGARTKSNLGVLIIPLLVFGIAWYLHSQAALWFVGPAYAADGFLDTELAIAGASTEMTTLLDVSGVTPEVYWAPVGTSDLSAFLASKDVALFPEDIVRTFPNPDLQVGGAVKVYRAQAVLVRDAGQEQLIHTWKNTIQEALAEHGIELGEKDKVEPSLENSILTNQRLVPVSVIITRVVETEIIDKETITYKSQTKLDNTIEKGVKEVVQAGKNGVKELTYLVRREDGVEVSRKLIDTEITIDPVNEIIKEGTKVKVYGTGVATWYTKRYNHVAAHNGLPRGTRVRVVNTATGKSTVVTVVGGGLYTDAVIDLSYDAFSDIGNPGAGRLAVRLEKVYD